jgi:hypothetical protein
MLKNDKQRAADFSKLLRERLTELQMDPFMFMFALRMRQIGRVISWLNGTALPPAGRIGDISRVLDLCPAETFLIWVGGLDPQSEEAVCPL